ncbi:Voltage-dependent calcium channel subunit alpha-2/delta-2 (Voltage-gated calcium channel subunit alpha-2/delta-2) [Cleaved into: Voltage-dependent calcium channel subunit alpha-2-2, partial [Durusdinium trenchii]
DASGTRHCYPADYGLGACKDHDEGLDPFCSSLFPPDFCRQDWCFVDPSACNAENFESSFFPGRGLYYSYGTCGSINSFAAWIGESVPRSMTDLIALMESYVINTKTVLEQNVQQVKQLVASGGTSECGSLTSSCDTNACSACTTSDCWKGKNRDTRSTNVVLHPVLESVLEEDKVTQLTCMSQFISNTFRQTASKEYNSDGRVAYQYYGDAASGALAQWPATTFCSSTYDARRRPWYSAAASRRKHVVLVIDVSQSMDEFNRINLARKAVKAVLETLSWTDGATLITFNDQVTARYSSRVETTSETELAKMKAWVDENVVAKGGTEFEAPIRMAADILKRSTDKACSQSILFLSDGADASGFQVNALDDVPDDVPIFSYALGSSASETALQQMACATGGVYYPVPNEAELPAAMASYYNYFVQLTDPCSVNWILYSDAVTGAELLGGCSPIFDTTTDTTQLQGVNCVDLNIVVDPKTLRSCSNGAFDDFIKILKRQASTCPASGERTVTGCALKSIRERVGESSVCPDDSNLTNCGNTNIASSATSCSAPDPNRFSDIVLDECDMSLSECTNLVAGTKGTGGGADEDGGGGVVGIVVGVAVGLIVLLGIVFFTIKSRKKKTLPSRPTEIKEPDGHHSNQDPNNSGRTPPTQPGTGIAEPIPTLPPSPQEKPGNFRIAEPIPTPPPHHWDVFLSHSQGTAKDKARSLLLQLEVKGFRVWFDQHDPMHVDVTPRGMRKGVENSAVFLIFLTSDYFTRDFCRFELDVALEESKPIILVHETDSRLHAFDFSNPLQGVPEKWHERVQRVLNSNRSEKYETDTVKAEVMMNRIAHRVRTHSYFERPATAPPIPAEVVIDGNEHQVPRHSSFERPAPAPPTQGVSGEKIGVITQL